MVVTCRLECQFVHVGHILELTIDMARVPDNLVVCGQVS